MALLRAPDQFSPQRRGAATTPTCGGCCCCCCVGSVVGTSIALPVSLVLTDERDRRTAAWMREEPVAPRGRTVGRGAALVAAALPIGVLVTYGMLVLLGVLGPLQVLVASAIGYIVAVLVAALGARWAKARTVGPISTWLRLHLAVWVGEAVAATYLINATPQPQLRMLYGVVAVLIAVLLPVAAWLHYRRLVHERDV